LGPAALEALREAAALAGGVALVDVPNGRSYFFLKALTLLATDFGFLKPSSSATFWLSICQIQVSNVEWAAYTMKVLRTDRSLKWKEFSRG
jgi:hypothetical protein